MKNIVIHASWDQTGSDGACQFFIRLLFLKIEFYARSNGVKWFNFYLCHRFQLLLTSAQFEIVQGFSESVVIDRFLKWPGFLRSKQPVGSELGRHFKNYWEIRWSYIFALWIETYIEFTYIYFKNILWFQRP